VYVKQEPREISQSIERYNCDFTPDERRILYDSAVKITQLPNHDHIGNDLMGVDDVCNKTDHKPKTELDILQEQRDLKRRRVAYRGKRVHTDRKSYKEVLREVVDGLTKSLSSQHEDKSTCVKTSDTVTETVSNNRLIYKYEGSQNYVGNPYTRWLDIKTEESRLLKYYDEKNGPFQETSTSRIRHLKNETDNRKSRNSRSKSKERRRSRNELQLKRPRWSRSRSKYRDTEYMNYNRSRIPLEFNETNSKRFESKSKETMYRKSRSRSRLIGNEHKRSKRHENYSESKARMSRMSRSRSVSTDSKHNRSKRSRTRSKCKEFSSRKKAKSSKSPINYFKSTLSNENDTTAGTSKSSDDLQKEHKHKKKRKHSKSHKKSHKSKKE